MKITNQQLEEAIIYAATKHKGQKRKGNGMPYIIHPLRVMNIILSATKSENINLLLIVCLLHDVVEDCGVPISEIAEKFGYQVASLVEELTLDKTQYEKQGKAVYLLNHMLEMSSYALRIKLADRIDNINDTESMNTDFKEKYKKETQYILDGIGARKLTRTHKKLIRILQRAVNKIKV